MTTQKKTKDLSFLPNTHLACLTPLARFLYDQLEDLLTHYLSLTTKKKKNISIEHPTISNVFKRLSKDLMRVITTRHQNLRKRNYQKSENLKKIPDATDPYPLLVNSPESYLKRYKSPYMLIFPESEIVLLHPYTLFQCARPSIMKNLVSIMNAMLRRKKNLIINVEHFCGLLSVAHQQTQVKLDVVQKKILAFFGFVDILQNSLHALDLEKMVKKFDIRRDDSVIRRRTWSLLNENIVTLTFRVNHGKLGFNTYYIPLRAISDPSDDMLIHSLIPRYYSLSTLLFKEDFTDNSSYSYSYPPQEHSKDAETTPIVHSVVHVPYHWKLNDRLKAEGAIFLSNFQLTIDLFDYFNLKPAIHRKLRKELIKMVRSLTVDDLLEPKEKLTPQASFSLNVHSFMTVEHGSNLTVDLQPQWLETHPQLTGVKLKILHYFSSNQGVQQAAKTLAEILHHDDSIIANHIKTLLEEGFLYYYPMYRQIGLHHYAFVSLKPQPNSLPSTSDVNQETLRVARNHYLSVIHKMLSLISPIARVFRGNDTLIAMLSLNVAHGRIIQQLLSSKNHQEIQKTLNLELKFIFSPKRFNHFDYIWRQLHLDQFDIERRVDDALLFFSHPKLPAEWQ